MTTETFNVGPLSDFPENSMKAVEINDESILVIHQDGKVYAMPNECTHAKFPLDDGSLLEGKIKCQYHGATYNLETGAAGFPAVKKIRLFTASIEEDNIVVSLQEN